MRSPGMFRLGIVLLGAVGVFLLGRLSVTPVVRGEVRSATSAVAPCDASQSAENTHAMSRLAPTASPPPKAAATTPDPSRQSRQQAQLSEADPVGRASSVLATLERMSKELDPPPGAQSSSPAIRAQRTLPFVRGFVAALNGADPLVVQALADQITERFCGNGSLKESQRIVLAQLADANPALLTRESADCFFTRAKGKEDGPVWDMADAWRASGLDKTPAIAEFEAAAKDERTRMAFMPPEQIEKEIANAATPPALPTAQTYTAAQREQLAQARATARTGPTQHVER